MIPAGSIYPVLRSGFYRCHIINISLAGNEIRIRMERPGMYLHHVIYARPATALLPQERIETAGPSFPGAAGITGEIPGIPEGGAPDMTYAGGSAGNLHQEASPATSPKPAWFIITSEEIGNIYRHLSEIERNAPEHDRESTREISRIIETVERPLA